MPRTTQLIASGKIEIKEIEFLAPGPGEAIVEVQYEGVCGTDLALFQGDYPVPYLMFVDMNLQDESKVLVMESIRNRLAKP